MIHCLPLHPPTPAALKVTGARAGTTQSDGSTTWSTADATSESNSYFLYYQIRKIFFYVLYTVQVYLNKSTTVRKCYVKHYSTYCTLLYQIQLHSKIKVCAKTLFLSVGCFQNLYFDLSSPSSSIHPIPSQSPSSHTENLLFQVQLRRLRREQKQL